MTRRIEPAPAQRVRGTRLATALRAGADGEGLAVEPVFAAPRDGPDAFRVRGLSATGFLGAGLLVFFGAAGRSTAAPATAGLASPSIFIFTGLPPQISSSR